MFSTVRLLIVFSVLLCMPYITNGTTYVAISSGLYNQSSIWQGNIAPPPTLNGDTIVIPWNANVYLTSAFSAINTGNRLVVDGWLNANNADVNLSNCDVLGSGTIDDIDSLSGLSSINAGFTGTLATKILLGASINTKASIVVFDALHLPDSMIISDGYMELQKVDIFVSGRYGSNPKGPSLQIRGNGKIGAPSSDNVYYRNGSTYAGLEWSLAKGKITIQVEDTSRVILSNDVATPHSYGVIIQSGILDLNGHTLTIRSLALLSEGYIASNKWSSMMFSYCYPPVPIRFLPSEDTIGTLSVIPQNCTLIIGSNLYIHDTLQSNSHIIIDTGNDLRLLEGAAIISSGHIITRPTATLSQYLNKGDSIFFPVSTGYNYSPVMIKSRNNTEYDYFSVCLIEGVYEDGFSGKPVGLYQPCVNLTWILDCSPRAAIDYDLDLTWNIGPEFNSFDRSSSYISHYLNSKWDKHALAPPLTPYPLMYTLSRENITTTGPFAIFDKNTNVSVKHLNRNNIVIPFPSPAKNLLNITVKEQATATIYNTAGQVVLKVTVSANNNTIDISQLTPGVYFIQLRGEQINSTAKFVKE